MNEFYAWFWAAMIFLSVAWYAVLLCYVGLRGGGEIVQLAKSLSGREETPDGEERPAQGGSDGIL